MEKWNLLVSYLMRYSFCQSNAAFLRNLLQTFSFFQVSTKGMLCVQMRSLRQSEEDLKLLSRI